MNTCCCGGDTREVLHPSSTAKLSSTWTCTANAPCFLSSTNLFHLNADVESSCKILYELSKVNSFVCNVIEDCFIAVALVLHITNLHFQSQALSYLPTLYHCSVFTGFCLMILLHVNFFSQSIYSFDIIG